MGENCFVFKINSQEYLISSNLWCDIVILPDVILKNFTRIRKKSFEREKFTWTPWIPWVDG